jgi:hypothetical protein
MELAAHGVKRVDTCVVCVCVCVCVQEAYILGIPEEYRTQRTRNQQRARRLRERPFEFLPSPPLLLFTHSHKEGTNEKAASMATKRKVLPVWVQAKRFALVISILFFIFYFLFFLTTYDSMPS